jgi:hypothetical protein
LAGIVGDSVAPVDVYIPDATDAVENAFVDYVVEEGFGPPQVPSIGGTLKRSATSLWGAVTDFFRTLPGNVRGLFNGTLLDPVVLMVQSAVGAGGVGDLNLGAVTAAYSGHPGDRVPTRPASVLESARQIFQKGVIEIGGLGRVVLSINGRYQLLGFIPQIKAAMTNADPTDRIVLSMMLLKVNMELEDENGIQEAVTGLAESMLDPRGPLYNDQSVLSAVFEVLDGAMYADDLSMEQLVRNRLKQTVPPASAHLIPEGPATSPASPTSDVGVWARFSFVVKTIDGIRKIQAFLADNRHLLVGPVTTETPPPVTDVLLSGGAQAAGVAVPKSGDKAERKARFYTVVRPLLVETEGSSFTFKVNLLIEVLFAEFERDLLAKANGDMDTALNLVDQRWINAATSEIYRRIGSNGRT